MILFCICFLSKEMYARRAVVDICFQVLLFDFNPWLFLIVSYACLMHKLADVLASVQLCVLHLKTIFSTMKHYVPHQ